MYAVVTQTNTGLIVSVKVEATEAQAIERVAQQAKFWCNVNDGRTITFSPSKKNAYVLNPADDCDIEYRVETHIAD